MPYHDRPADDEFAPFYADYVARVGDGDLIAILRAQLDGTVALIRALEGRADHAYAPGKWTVKEVILHLCDAERVFACRALRIARGDTTPLPGFDEAAYAPESGAADRSIDGLVAELRAVRGATLALLEGLPAVAWTRGGTASGAVVSVRAIAAILAGHELHHCAILRERYMAPAGADG